MNNEPVAWTDGDDICPALGYGTRITTEHPKDLGWQPLYTHPAKELTDEEILEQSVFCFGNQSEDFDDSYWINFARAILRKAQEK
jgi:hypothetical protein